MNSLSKLAQKVELCKACPRLRRHCLKTAEIKRKSYQAETYWGKPISGFGDPQARLLIVGLAPAAHGANRTGRIFTGDRSGDWLYRALHRFDFANQPHSTHAQDGLRLNDAYISCVVKCAPPENKPSPVELKRCQEFLRREIELLPRLRVIVALGGIALKGVWPLLQYNPMAETMTQTQTKSAPLPKFSHGASVDLPQDRKLILSYHPSQQNTFTGRLTEPMLDSIFSRAREFLD